MDRLLGLIEEVHALLTEEAAGRLKGIEREGALVALDRSPTVVVGDIHGDLRALEEIFDRSGILGKIGKGWRIIFLGDYADRGPDSLGVYEAILGLKVSHPSHVLMMRGNHEASDVISLQPHDLPANLRARYGSHWSEAYESLLKLHALLPSAAMYGDLALLVHGGVFKGVSRSALVKPKRAELEMMLWNGPFEEIGYMSVSPRGAGARFGAAITHEALKSLGVEVILRGHSAVPRGYRFNHGGRVLTIFSSKNVYSLESGAYLVLEGGRSVADGVRLF
jgi:protein phosphatase